MCNVINNIISAKIQGESFAVLPESIVVQNNGFITLFMADYPFEFYSVLQKLSESECELEFSTEDETWKYLGQLIVLSYNKLRRKCIYFKVEGCNMDE